MNPVNRIKRSFAVIVVGIVFPRLPEFYPSLSTSELKHLTLVDKVCPRREVFVTLMSANNPCKYQHGRIMQM